MFFLKVLLKEVQSTVEPKDVVRMRNVYANRHFLSVVAHREQLVDQILNVTGVSLPPLIPLTSTLILWYDIIVYSTKAYRWINAVVALEP